MYTFFVLDYDGTYNCVEEEEPHGVPPSVYIVQSEQVGLLYPIAQRAHDLFHEDEVSDACIQDYFDELIIQEGITAKFVGPLNILFEERMGDYLDPGISTEVV